MKFSIAIAALLPLLLASLAADIIEERAIVPNDCDPSNRTNSGCDQDEICVPNGPNQGGQCSPAPPQKIFRTKDGHFWTKITCGGTDAARKRLHCPYGQVCAYPPSSPCYNNTSAASTTSCTGLCVGAACADGIVGYPNCPDGQTCVKAPRQPSQPKMPENWMCVFSSGGCGGKAGAGCPLDWTCVDKPSDECGPNDPTRNKGCDGLCAFDKGVSGNAEGDPLGVF